MKPRVAHMLRIARKSLAELSDGTPSRFLLQRPVPTQSHRADPLDNFVYVTIQSLFLPARTDPARQSLEHDSATQGRGCCGSLKPRARAIDPPFATQVMRRG
jgi:hypothetical protein